jgi:hypothetical protein
MKKNKKNTPIKAAEVNSPITKTATRGFSFSNASDLLTILFCCLYFIVEFIPNLGATDDQGPQWVYLVLLDMGIVAYFLNNKGEYTEAVFAVFNSLFSKLYTTLFLLAGISIFFAINRTEGWVCYVRFIATIIAFFNLAILLYKRQNLFPTLIAILAVIVLFQSIQELYFFFTQMGNNSLTSLVLKLKGNAGNKNIFAASVLAKISFVMYGLYHSNGAKKLFYFFVFLLTVWLIYLLNSRTTYVALFSISFFYLAFCSFQFYKQKNKDILVFNGGGILLGLIIAYFFSLMSLSAAKSSYVDESSSSYGTVLDRVAGINSPEDDSRKQRLFLCSKLLTMNLIDCEV